MNEKPTKPTKKQSTGETILIIFVALVIALVTIAIYAGGWLFLVFVAFIIGLLIH